MPGELGRTRLGVLPLGRVLGARGLAIEIDAARERPLLGRPCLMSSVIGTLERIGGGRAGALVAGAQVHSSWVT